MHRLRNLLLVLLVLVLIIAALVYFYLKANPTTSQPAGATPTATMPVGATVVGPGSSGLAIHVSGNKLVNAQGKPIQLVGVNVIAGSCVQRPHSSLSILFVGQSYAATAAAIAGWHANVVRITPSEDCWLGINGVNPTYSGATYQNGIVNFVNLLHSHGIYVIIDLHSSAPGSSLSINGQVMADADHAPAYWQSVATVFKKDPAVIFEPYNEPRITTSNAQTTNPWQCWLDGCTITVTYGSGNRILATNAPWQAVGMQSLVNTIRSTGATNPILLSGLNLAEDLTQLLRYLPSDPQHQLIANYHNYQGPRNTLAYWNTTIASVSQHMPVITSEFGERDCQSTFVDTYMNWADQHNISYIPWVWTPWQCSALGLLSDWSGTPNSYGQVFYTHFHQLNP